MDWSILKKVMALPLFDGAVDLVDEVEMTLWVEELSGSSGEMWRKTVWFYRLTCCGHVTTPVAFNALAVVSW